MSELPIICTLNANELQQRREELLPGLLKQADSCELLETGMRLSFAASPELFGAITRMIDAERQCCRFLRFQLTVEPNLGPLRLEVTGPPGTAGFLSTLLSNIST